MRSRQRAEQAERERAEQAERADALRAERDRLREALDVLPHGVIVRDADGVEVLRNRKAASPTGDLHADVLVAREVEQLLAEPSARHRTVELHGPPRRSLELVITPLVSGGLVVFIEDATERRRVDLMRRDFVDNVSHELRTPIGALRVLAEALEGEQDVAVVHRLVGRMAAEVDRAQVLIEDLLDLSRIERATERPQAPVDIADVVAAAVERIAPLSDRSGVRVDVSVPTTTIEGDREELVSAVANLLDNAVKFSSPDSTIDITADAYDGMVDIVVHDRGVGIPAKDLDRIFERFYRVDRARDRKTGGSGLGLSIVRHVAMNHGGEVLVSSVEGEGSTFTLRLRAVGAR